jgi:hypothetical protein
MVGLGWYAEWLCNITSVQHYWKVTDHCHKPLSYTSLRLNEFLDACSVDIFCEDISAYFSYRLSEWPYQMQTYGA